MNSKQRHEKEIAARRLEAERLAVKAREKENLDRQQNALRRQKEFREKTQIWNEQVLPRWHELFQGNTSHIGIGWSGFLGAGGSAKVRDLCHKGIPPNIRGKVWPLMIKNDLKIDGEIFEHLNRKVIQIYGVNLTANKPVHPEDQKNHSICPVYRDSFLGLFDEDHPLYPRDGSPAAKILAARGPVVGGPGAAAKAAMFRVNSGLPTSGSRVNNSANAPPPERSRTVSVMKRAQSLSSLATLVTSSQSSASTFTMKLSPMRGRPAGEEDGAEEGEGEADGSAAELDSQHHLHTQEHSTHREGSSTPTHTAHMTHTTPATHTVRSATPQVCIDVTDEPWFQNERNGSLDQSAFEFVQKQLFQGTDMAESRTRSMASIDGGSLRFGSPMKSTVLGAASSSVLQMEAGDPDAPERPSLLRRRSNSTSAYMDSPSLRKHRGKSENDTAEAEVPAGSSPNGTGPLRNMTISTAGNAGNISSNSGRYSPHNPMSGKYSENGTRVEVLLSSARKVNDHFFLSSSSDGEGDSSDDDVIPHIIPQDIQSRSIEDDNGEGEGEVEGSEGGYAGTDSAVNTPSVISSASPERTLLSRTDAASYASPDKTTLPGLRTVTPPRLNSTASSQGAVGLSLSADEADGDTPFGTPQPRPRPSVDYPHQAGLLLTEDNAHRPPIARDSNAAPSSHSKQRPHLFPHTEGSVSPLRSAAHSPNHSYSHSYSHNSHSASHSYTQGNNTRTTPSRDGRSYSRQSIEEILHNAMVERDTEGTVLTPSNSRFSFQSTSSNARLGSIDGATSLLTDEPISVRDDNYFPCAVQPTTTNNSNNTESNRSASSASGGAANASSGGANNSNNGNANNANGDRQASDSSRINNSTEEHNQQLLNSMSLIEWDLPRTYPTLGFFHDGGPMHTGLERVLMCYVCYRPDVGYVQGMSYLVATLLLYMDEFEAFKCMANLLGRRLNMDFYCLQKEAIESYVQCFNVFFEMNLPLLYEHFRMEGVTSEMFLMDWMMSLFTKTLPLEVAAHIWDVYLYEGEMYLMCVALGILKMYAPRLSMCTVEKVSPFLLHLPEDIKPEELFHCISQIKISRKKYDRIRLKMAIKCYGSLEAYQKSQEPVPPVVLDPITIPTATTSPNSSNNVHYISSAPAKSPNTASPNNNTTGNTSAAPDFWERRRMFRRSIFEKWTLRRWLPSPTVTNSDAGAAGAGAKPATRRASTTYGGATPNTSASNSASKNRRASTTAVNK